MNRNLLLLAALTLSTPVASRADDGALSYGGAPALLSGHPSVAMKSEVVQMTVGKENVLVECNFVFKNTGKKCEVRMGFPDVGEGAADPDESSEGDWKKTPAKTTFNWYKSWVDGAPVKTQLIRSNKPGEYWHAKTVSFGANQTRRVRDEYSVPVGGGIAPTGQGYVSETFYILHTGKSWRGPIGRCEIIVRFAAPMNAQTLRPQWFRWSDNFDELKRVKWTQVKNGRVLYSGPCRATSRGLTLRFLKTNFEPQDKDDVSLTFNYKSTQINASTSVKTFAKLPYIDEYPFNRALTESDLKNRSATQLKLMRNAIYARRGRPFQDAELKKFFEAKNWYRKDEKWSDTDDDAKLSTLEKQNAAFISRYAKSH